MYSCVFVYLYIRINVELWLCIFADMLIGMGVILWMRGVVELCSCICVYSYSCILV